MSSVYSASGQTIIEEPDANAADEAMPSGSPSSIPLVRPFILINFHLTSPVSISL